MESNWAVEHLQVIRTLMERSALYRRTLAPVMLTIGSLGLVAALAGWLAVGQSSLAFVNYWCGVGMLGLIAAYLLVRRQALKAAEPFWSPPTRRVTQALLPAFFGGCITLIAMIFPRWRDPLQAWWLPALWMILYGCAMHAAGFFMPRGMKLFGWVFILAGGGLFLGLSAPQSVPPLRYAHIVMGVAFGGLHLAYGLYLYLTEQENNAA